MLKNVGTLCLFLCFAITSKAQQDTTALTGIYERITHTISNFNLDTTSPPNDKITRKIHELQQLRGGFNIHEALQFKIAEDRKNKAMPEKELDALADYFTTGQGKILLDRAMTWIYRSHFTYKELKQLVRFYKTTAGKKMASDFPLIMMQSLRAAEMIKEMYEQEMKKK